MDSKTFSEHLDRLMACNDAKEWAHGKSLEDAWSTCHRGDWMLWLAKRAGVDKRNFTLAKGKCAELVKHLMKDRRSILAVETAIKYGNGEATDQELAAAADDAYAAADDAYADAAAADDAYADAAAAAAAAAAAYAAYAADAAAAAADAKKDMQQKTADAVRGVIDISMLKFN